MALEPGTLVGANVRLSRLLGQGGMGSVWIAEHLTLKTEVAVKFMATEILKDSAATARFTREATAAARIKSPHVVQTFDHGVSADGIPYIVMELLEGEDLGKRLSRLVAVSLQDTVTIVTQVCKALSRAHAVGIVHRDIKPENIFLLDTDGDLFVKVLDFGIAKNMAPTPAMAMTSTGTMVGTPYYMSPEQMLSAKDVDLRSDIWSLGVVAYHAFTGQMPFAAETLGSLCVAIDRCKFAPPSSLRQGVPAAVDAWFARAISREPENRFASAREMADALALAAGTSSMTIGSIPVVDASGSSIATLSQSSPQALVPAMPTNTLLEASVTGATRPRRRVLALGLAAGAAALVLMAGAGTLAWRLSVSNPKPAAGERVMADPPVVANPAAPAVTPAVTPAVEPVSPPASSAPEPAPSASAEPEASLPSASAEPEASLPSSTPAPRPRERPARSTRPREKPAREKPDKAAEPKQPPVVAPPAETSRERDRGF